MKKRIKTITTIVLLAFILSVLSPCTVFAAESPQDAAIETALEYMNIRKEMLLTGNTAILEAIAISGIVADEIKHRDYLSENNVAFPTFTYTIDYVDAWDTAAVVNLREVGVSPNGDPIEVSHELTITTNENDMPFVVSDNYYEVYSGFESCSYVPLAESMHSRALVIPSKKCFVQIATNEIGYIGKATNSQLDSPTANPEGDYTKYTAWFGGQNGVPWCAIFVSWCANQAHIPETTIKKTADVWEMRDFFKGKNRFYNISDNSIAASFPIDTNHRPTIGDLVFIYHNGDKYSHIGIVASVSSSSFTIIDGNWNNRVDTRQYSFTNSTITAYASPDILLTEHIWTGTAPNQYCSNCGASWYELAD